MVPNIINTHSQLILFTVNLSYKNTIVPSLEA